MEEEKLIGRKAIMEESSYEEAVRGDDLLLLFNIFFCVT